MLALGDTETVRQPTEWLSGRFIDPKSNGKIWMYVDITMLNRGA